VSDGSNVTRGSNVSDGQNVSGGPNGLVAARIPLDPGPPVDPFALAGATGILFHTGGRVLVGLGTALTIPLPHGLESEPDLRGATDAMASIPCRDEVDAAIAGVVGFATLPFDRSAPAALVVPEVTFGSDADDREWVTIVSSDPTVLPTGPAGLRSWLVGGGATSDLAPNGPGAVGHPADAGREPGVRSVTVVTRAPDTSFLAMVADALGAIDRGDLVKVVLARQVDVTLGEVVDIPGLLRRWRSLEPNCGLFSLPTQTGQFVGASPELLVDRTGRRVRSRPLAGTAERDMGGDSGRPSGALLDSRKDAAEHQLVVRAIDEALRPLCAELDVPLRPDLVHLHNLVHLGTPVNGLLAERPDGGVPTALELVGALHPTPAVGGAPRPAALALIDRLEPESRGHYAGPVGYVDARGDGRWMVGIRAMAIAGANARLAAGVGIVDGSSPESELEETALKLAAVLDALAPDRPTRCRRTSARAAVH
jgi:menaquinone-specific isochorismate synthase